MKEIKSKLLSITWPIMIELILMYLLGSIDIFMLGKYSDEAVAIVGVSNQIIWMVNLMFVVITSGTTILLTQYFGSNKDEKNIVEICGLSIGVNGVLGIVLSIVIILGGEFMFKLLNTPSELISMGNTYMGIVGGASFVAAIMMTFTAILRAYGLTKTCMKITILMNVVNVIGNYILIFGNFGFPQLGIAGAAISTTLSKVVACIFLGYRVYKVVMNKFKLDLFKIFPVNHLKNIVSIGLPTLGEQLSYNLSQLVITSIINTIGIASMATKTYVGNIAFLAYLFAQGVAQGGSVLIGRLIGEGEKDKAFNLFKYCVTRSLIVTISMSILLAIVGKYILAIFTTNEEILVLGSQVLFVNIFLEFGRTTNLIGINGLRATGDVKFPVYIAIFSMWTFAVGISYVLGIGLGLGLIGVWIGFALDEIIRGVLVALRWKSRKWEDKSFVR